MLPLGSRLKAMDKPEQPAVGSRQYQKNPSEQPPSATVSMSWFRLFKARGKSSMAGLNWRHTAETVWNSSLLHTAVHCTPSSVHANLTAHLTGHQLKASQSLSFPHWSSYLQILQSELPYCSLVSSNVWKTRRKYRAESQAAARGILVVHGLNKLSNNNASLSMSNQWNTGSMGQKKAGFMYLGSRYYRILPLSLENSPIKHPKQSNGSLWGQNKSMVTTAVDQIVLCSCQEMQKWSYFWHWAKLWRLLRDWVESLAYPVQIIFLKGGLEEQLYQTNGR